MMIGVVGSEMARAFEELISRFLFVGKNTGDGPSVRSNDEVFIKPTIRIGGPYLVA